MLKKIKLEQNLCSPSHYLRLLDERFTCICRALKDGHKTDIIDKFLQ